jgi:hypothetical protein
MRGIKTPFVVDFTSRMEEALGVVVPMPALPLEGNVFCAKEILLKKISSATKSGTDKIGGASKHCAPRSFDRLRMTAKCFSFCYVWAFTYC